jgi:hypothetical protein
MYIKSLMKLKKKLEYKKIVPRIFIISIAPCRPCATSSLANVEIT